VRSGGEARERYAATSHRAPDVPRRADMMPSRHGIGRVAFVWLLAARMVRANFTASSLAQKCMNPKCMKKRRGVSVSR